MSANHVSEEEWAELLTRAREVQKHAYAPYSKFLVGAAILSDTGTVHVGANVENASYPLCMCAERNAVATAVNQGERTFKALVVVGPGQEPVPMCGACRQVWLEFAPDAPTRSYSERGTFIEATGRELLPGGFTPTFLDGAGSNHK